MLDGECEWLVTNDGLPVGYGTDVDLDVIRAWWSLLALGGLRMRLDDVGMSFLQLLKACSR